MSKKCKKGLHKNIEKNENGYSLLYIFVAID